VSHGSNDRLLRELIQFLDRLPMNIDFAGFAENFYQTGFVHFAGNDFRRESQTRQ